MEPNFLYIGPDKSGSTWLYNIFYQHPECYVPRIKDIYFFNKYYYRGIEWYLSFFKGAESTHNAIGELSHDYLFSIKTADRIRNDFPDIKLFATIRNPIDKIWSQYLFLRRSGVTRKSFKKAVYEYPELTAKNYYYKYLKNYIDKFRFEQFRIYLFDDFKKNNIKYIKNIFGFLNIKYIPELDYNRDVLKTSKARLYYLSKVVKKCANLSRILKQEELLGEIKQNRLINRLLYKEYNNKPKMDDYIKKYITQMYRDDILKTSSLINRDLSFWLEDK